MGVRFRGKIITHQIGTVYEVDIIDTTYSGAITNIILAGNGFELNYLNETEERTDPIKGSSCAVYCSITDDAAGTALATWMESRLNATKEDECFVSIKKDSAMYWYGAILPGCLTTRMDAPKPYRHIINATDGLARLKDKEFELAIEAYNDVTIGRKTFTELIYEVLKETPLYTTTENLLFSSAIDWYENEMPAKATAVDPLSLAKIRANTFAVLEQDKAPAALSYYDVLKKICEQWKMRVMLSGGLFRFYQINAYESGGTKYERFYLRSVGTFDGSAAFTGYPITVNNTSYPHIKQGNQWKWHNPLKFVYLKYPFKNSNMLNELESMPLVGTPSKYTYAETLRDNIIGGTSRRLRFNTSLRLYIYGGAGGWQYQASIRMKIKVGSNYLQKDILAAFGTEVWTSVSTDTYDHMFQVRQGYNNLDISFETPDLPSGSFDANDFYIELTEVYDVFGAAFLTPNTDFTCNRNVGSTQLTYNSSSSSSNEDYFEYIGGNTTSPINSYDLTLEESLIGEPIDPSNPGNLFVYNGTTWLQSTAQWRVGDTGTAFDFNLLRVREVLSGQTKPVRKYQGSFIGDSIEAHHSIEYDGYRHILAQATYLAQFEIWTGEWFAVSLDHTPFYDRLPSTPKPDGEFTKNIGKHLGGLRDTANQALMHTQSFAAERQLTETISIITAGAQTNIDVVAMGTVLIKEGDYLRIIPPGGGTNYQVQVAADYTVGNTYITINSYTFPYNIPVGSIICFDMRRTALEYLRIGLDFPTTDPSIEGVVFNDGGFLKVSAG